MIRHFKPKRIVEIGCGNSTLLIAQALRNEGLESACEFLCIEPFPPAYLQPLPEGVSKLINSDVQSASLDHFKSLESGDILFIDSTHVSKIESDVVYEYLEILPVLKPGVIIHIHDIFLPYEYPKNWIEDLRFFWNEQYMLKAFLLFNNNFNVMVPSHAMYREQQKIFEKMVPSLRETTHPPSAFWMVRI